jgi:PilZ domain
MKPAGPAALRRSVRVQVRVPVTVSGTQADGSKFRQQAHIMSVSKFGAKLKTDLSLKVGAQVRIQPPRGSKPGLFRVVWVGREGTPRAGEIGIEYLQVSNLLGITFPE